MSEQKARKTRIKPTHGRHIAIATALLEYERITDCLPEVAVEAVIRLRKEGMSDCGDPATLRRLRELINTINIERVRIT